MFSAMSKRWFLAKIMAEVKAQHSNQDFVNRLVSSPDVLEAISGLNRLAYYRKRKDAYFLYACEALSVGMNDAGLSLEDQAICEFLLASRLQKANSDPHYYSQNILLFGNWSNLLDEKANSIT